MTRVHSSELDQFKGILICLVVLGHNYLFSGEYPGAFSYIYGFHVVCFLLFPYLFLQNGVASGRLRNTLFSMIVPHCFFIALVGMMFFAINIVWGQTPFMPWLEDVVVTLLLQRETLLRANLGAGFLWFLPALGLQALLLFFYQNAGRFSKVVFVVMAILFHLFVGVVDAPWVLQLPFSLSLVGYIAAIGFSIHYLHGRVRWSTGSSLFVILLWMIASWYAISEGFFHPLAGDLYKSPVSILQPVELFLQDGLILLSFFALLRISFFIRSAALAELGRHSLAVFLLHPFVWQVLWQLGLNQVHVQGVWSGVFATLTSFILTIVLTLILVRIIRRTPIQKIVFPRRPTDWGLRYG